MKIAIKYGLIITAVVIVWVVVVRFLLNVGPESRVKSDRAGYFQPHRHSGNPSGHEGSKKELGGDLRFKEGLKTGMGISLVYAISACLFFIVEFLVAGPKLLMSEAGAQDGPMWKVAAFAYAGLFFGSLIFGMIYSAIIAAFLARRLPRESSEII